MSYGTTYLKAQEETNVSLAFSAASELKTFYRDSLKKTTKLQYRQCCIKVGSLYYFIDMSYLFHLTQNEVRVLKATDGFTGAALLRRVENFIDYASLTKEDKQEFALIRQYADNVNIFFSYLNQLEEIADKHSVNMHSLTGFKLPTGHFLHQFRPNLDALHTEEQRVIGLTLKHLIAPSLEARIGEILLVYNLAQE